MTETIFANARAAVWIWRYVEDDVVRARGITRYSPDSRQGTGGGHMVQPQKISHAPGYIVVRARGIAANADAANNVVARRVERKSPAKHVDAADL